MQTLQGKDPRLKVFTNWTPELGRVDMIPDAYGWYDLDPLEEDEGVSLCDFWGSCRIVDSTSGCVVAAEPHKRLKRHDYNFSLIHKQTERSKDEQVASIGV